MGLSKSLYLLTILFFFHDSSLAITSFEQTCQAIEESHISYDFCYRTLKPYPGIDSADAHGVGVAAVEQTLHQAIVIQSEINNEIVKLQKRSSKGKANSVEPLDNCNKTYSASIPYLKKASQDMKSKKYRVVQIQLLNALKTPVNCAADSISRENKEFSETADLAMAITKQLEKKGGPKASHI